MFFVITFQNCNTNVWNSTYDTKNPDFYQFFCWAFFDGMATWFVIIPGRLINQGLGDKGQNEQTCKDFFIPATWSDQANGGVFMTLVGALDDLVRCREKPSYVQLKAGRVQLFPIRWKDSTDISVRSAFHTLTASPTERGNLKPD